MAQSNKKKIFDLFGTDTLPTAYTDKMGAGLVLSEIKRLNPGAHVSVIDSQAGRIDVRCLGGLLTATLLICWVISFYLV